MPAPVTINIAQGATGAPVEYTIPDSLELEPLSIFAHYDGSAAGNFRPSVSVYSGAGLLLARVFPFEPVTAGDEADVTFAPFLGKGGAPPIETDWATVISNYFTLDPIFPVEPNMNGGSGETKGDHWDVTFPEGWITTSAPGYYFLMQQVIWGLIGPPAGPFSGMTMQSWRPFPASDPGITIATQMQTTIQDAGDIGLAYPVGESSLSAIMIVTANIEGPIAFVPQVLQLSPNPQQVRVQQTIVRTPGHV